METTSAFLSYTRRDDETVDGLITKLKDVLERHVEFVTGKPIDIFLDTDDIGLGQDWRQRLESAIQDARFFMPVITPRYFNSTPCTFELTRFHALEQAANRNDLILPIYLQTADVLELENLRRESPLATIIEQRNYADWRGLFPQPLESIEGKRLVHELSLKIKGAIAKVPALPASAMHLQNQIDDLRQENAALKAKAQNLETSSGQHTEDLKNEIEKLAGALKAKQTELHAAQTRIGELEASRQSAVEANSALQEEVAHFKGLSAKRPTAKRRYAPGEVFRDGEDFPEMVVVPAGHFLMGSPSDELGYDDSQGPQHRVTIPKPFAVGRFAVTFDEWDACVAQGGGAGYRPVDNGWGRSKQPVINVSWEDAQAYLEWLRGKSGEDYRLLSEAEWEYAARAGTVTPFHSGQTITTDQANYNGNYSYGSGRKGEYRKQTVSVKTFEPNEFGLYQVHGNVWEWVEDRWHDSYKGAPDNGDAWVGGNNFARVLRGGSWDGHPRNLRSAYRFRLDAVDRYYGIGFRVARTLR